MTLKTAKTALISPVFTQDCFKILTFFSLSPGSRWRRKEIKEKTRLHNVPLDKALGNLIQAGAIIKEKNHYALNFENENAKKLIEFCSRQYRQLRELPLDVFYLLVDLAAVPLLQKGVEVHLFGSYTKLVYHEKSDVDIALLYSGEIDKSRLAAVVTKLEKTYHKHIDLHYFERAAFYKNKNDPLVKGILKDGVGLW